VPKNTVRRAWRTAQYWLKVALPMMDGALSYVPPSLLTVPL